MFLDIKRLIIEIIYGTQVCNNFPVTVPLLTVDTWQNEVAKVVTLTITL
jgi:hypothetical protein